MARGFPSSGAICYPEFLVFSGGVSRTMAYYDEAFNHTWYIRSLAVPVMQKISPPDHIGPTGQQGINSELISVNYGTKSCTFVSKVLLPFTLSIPTYRKESQYVFCDIWAAHHRLISFTIIELPVSKVANRWWGTLHFGIGKYTYWQHSSCRWVLLFWASVRSEKRCACFAV